MSAPDLITDLLRSVSRAFYLSLRILPPRCRTPIATAYLLARSADTLADTEQLPAATRAEALSALRSALRGPGVERLMSLVPPTDGTAEARLLARLPESLQLLHALSPIDQASVVSIVDTLAEGMEADLAHFPPGQAVTALALPQDLDRHTYMAAGCVGEFWTEILVRHVPSLRDWHPDTMKEIGVRFGKALQLTNVLRDLPADLSEGRCYLPQSQLRSAGLTPEALREPGCWATLRPLYHGWMEVALGHFACARDYVLAIPATELKLRLSVLWPVLIGLATLAKLAHVNPLKGQRVKVSRGWIYQTLVLSLLAAPLNAVVQSWIESWIDAVRSGLDPARPDVRQVF